MRQSHFSNPIHTNDLGQVREIDRARATDDQGAHLASFELAGAFSLSLIRPQR